MMHCVCGASMCYVCRQPIQGYVHFSESTACADYNNMDEIHRKEMEEAYKKAFDEYLIEHPEARQIELKYDPKALLESLNATNKDSKQTPQVPQVNNHPHLNNNVNLAAGGVNQLGNANMMQVFQDMNNLVQMRIGQTVHNEIEVSSDASDVSDNEY